MTTVHMGEDADLCGVRGQDLDKVRATQERLLDGAEAARTASLFRLLGDPTRVRMLFALLEAGELCVCDLAATVEVPESNVSQNLRLLRAAGVVATAAPVGWSSTPSTTPTSACSSTCPVLTWPTPVRASDGPRVRAEVLGALANAATLLAVTAWVIVEAVKAFQHPEPIRGGPVLLIAIGGLAVNAISAVVLWRAAGRSLNMRGAFLHMAADAAGSVAVIIAAVAVLTVGADWVDPVASLAIAALVLWSTWGLLRDTLRVLLEATPAGIDPDEVTRCITDEPGVAGVHHLHRWNVSSEDAALSAHVVLTDACSMHDAQVTGDRLKVQLNDRFGISHATLELECHACDEPDHERTAEPRTAAGSCHGH